MIKKLIAVGAVMLIASALQVEAKKAPQPSSTPAATNSWLKYYKTSCGKTFSCNPTDFPSQQIFDDYLSSMHELLCGTGGIPEEFERPYPSTEEDPHGVKPAPEKKKK